MSYVDQNLVAGENVTFTTRLHWRLFIPPSIVTLLLALPIAATLMTERSARIYATIPIAFAALLFVAAALRRNSSEFAVTNRRVILKVGVLNTRTVELLHAKIEAIAVNQSLFGKMLGYGDISLTGSGGTRETFSGIENPLELRKAVQAQTGPQ